MLPTTPQSIKSGLWNDVPIIDESDTFSELVSKLALYISRSVDAAYGYDQLRTSVVGQALRPLMISLVEECHNPAIVAALMAQAYLYRERDDNDAGLSESRALACELVAWQLLTFLSEKELIDFLLYELPPPQDNDSAVLPGGPVALDGLAQSLAGMNALEIAAIADAKKFLSQRPVQAVVRDIWNGHVIFWQSLSVHAVKKARIFNTHLADPFTRLRVPKYQKAFQIAFFVTFLILYYSVLVNRKPHQIDALEVLLYIWILAFGYDELGEILDAGLIFYQTDFWSLWDLCIILVGAAFFATRVIGLVRNSDYLTDLSFDILSLVALFLVPRIFSIFSLNPYFGSLIPVLKEMTKTFCKFLPVIVVLYFGFLTTFSMLARDRLTLSEMSLILVKVFFGSSYLGFDVAVTISPLFGYPLMLIFVCLTNVLLLTSLVSLVSNSLTEYSIYVLESSTSRRLTYFMPPFNLIPLFLLRPLRLLLPSEQVRRIRIIVLKTTHAPFVAFIWVFEQLQSLISRRAPAPLAGTPSHTPARPLDSDYLTIGPNHDHGLAPHPHASALNKTPVRSVTHSTPAPAESALLVTHTADLIALVQTLSAKVQSPGTSPSDTKNSSVTSPSSMQEMSLHSTPLSIPMTLHSLPAQSGLLGLNCQLSEGRLPAVPWPLPTDDESEAARPDLVLGQPHPVPEVKERKRRQFTQPSRIFACDFCDMKFDRKSNLKDHNRTHGVNKRCVPCHFPGCKKFYGRKADVNRHVRSVSISTACPHLPFADDAGYQFHQKDSVSCEHCHKTFLRSDSLTRHNVDNCRHQKDTEANATRDSSRWHHRPRSDDEIGRLIAKT
ncbi:hypothetical protein DV737_g4706, partial [Chaetothyriales sp. CBS 132003]